MNCTHEALDRERAVMADGMCPLCMAVEARQWEREARDLQEKYGRMMVRAERLERDVDLRDAVIALYGTRNYVDMSFGYEPDSGRVDAWFCMGPNCGQRFGARHLDHCPVGAYESIETEPRP